MIPLSVVIITYNEEKHIAQCLDSVKRVADDILVVDSFSTDRTVHICEKKNARVISHSFQGHIEQKNFAITQARYPHVLSLDADEVISGELQESILRAKNEWKYDGYYFNRLNNFCGKWIKHGSWYPDRKLRLWDSKKGRWAGINPHDKFELIAGSSTGYLRGDLYHFTADTEGEYTEKMRRYARISAVALHSQNKKSNWLIVYVKSATAFIISYLLRFGFLDGRAGWKVSKLIALYTFWKYSALLAMQRRT